MRFLILVVCFILSFSVSFAGNDDNIANASQVKQNGKNDSIAEVNSIFVDSTINRHGSGFFVNAISNMVKFFLKTVSSFFNPSYERFEKLIIDFTNLLPVSVRDDIREKLLDILQYVHKDFYPSVVHWYNKKNVDDGKGLIDIVSGGFKPLKN
ncbi:MAG: hypothetical protein RL208_105 [Pseudomonadota bacterium]|jgi:hypothetical protein